jgi:hypothetical protein
VTEALNRMWGASSGSIRRPCRAAGDIGDLVEITGKRKTVGKAMPAYKEHRGQARIQMDGLTRENAGVALDESVSIRRITAPPAGRVVIAPITITPADRDLKYIGSLLDGLPVVVGDRIRATLFGTRSADFKVENTTPAGPVVINPTTQDRRLKKSGRGFYETSGACCNCCGSADDLLPIRKYSSARASGPGELLHIPGLRKTLIARATRDGGEIFHGPRTEIIQVLWES